MTWTIIPPPTPVEPVTEIFHGVPITDPYRWLEDQNSPRTRKWLDAQTTYSRAYFDAIPGRDRIRRRVEELLAVETISEPWKVGDRYFYLKREAYQEQATVRMREGNAGKEIVLVDPALSGGGPATAVSIVNISPAGNLLAYGLRRDGGDSQSVEFLDVCSRHVLPDRLPVGLGPGLVFSPDALGFYYSHEMFVPSRLSRCAVYWHRFGTELDEDREVFCGDTANFRVVVFGSADGQFLAWGVITSNDPKTIDLYFQDLAKGKAVRRIAQGIESVFKPTFVGHSLIALTDWEAPNRRIVAIDPDHPDRDNWRDIVPESEHRINDFAVVGNSVCFCYVENLSSRLEVFGLASRRHDTVPCPPHGTARLLQRPVESDTLLYTFSSFGVPQTIFSYHIPSGEHRAWAKTDVKCDPFATEVEQVRYKSKDGTHVPLFLVSRKDQEVRRPLPTFLTAYGGFGISRTPQFNAYSTFLVEQGCLLAIPNLRGGGELGEEWHRLGQRHRRQNAIDDFISAAEWLLQSGRASPGRIAIGGGSNGGLLVAAALTQRADLFRAVVCLGPLSDMLRYHRFDTANLYVDEYGMADNEADFHHLRAYSPYHNVKEGVPYPAVLFVSGDADTRCNPMHARKMTARLQRATTSRRRILLEHNPTWGHMPVQPLTNRIVALTDRLAFICHELGVSI